MTRRRLIPLFLYSLLLVLFLAGHCNAESFPDRPAPIALTDSMTEREAAPYLQELVASDSSLGIGDILSPQQQARFASVGPVVPNYGYGAGVRWFKLPVRNDSKQEEWLLELAYAPIDHADL